jgi:hypothetical protein
MPREPRNDSPGTPHHVIIRGVEQPRIVDGVREKAGRMIREFCQREKVGIEELKGGSRRARMPGIRSELAVRLMEECGLPMAEIGRQLGVTTSAVSRVPSKRERSHSM